MWLAKFFFLMSACLACSAVALADSESSGASAAPEQETASDVVQTMDAQLAVLDRTQKLLDEAYLARSQEIHARVKTAYKLLRPGLARMWVDRESRTLIAQRRAWVRRVLAQAQRELELVRDEMASVAGSRERLQETRRAASAITPPAPGSLRVPVAYSHVVEPFGSYRHDASQARLSRRGIVLTSRAGRNVRAVADGEVRYAGEVRGLGHAVIVDHGDFWSIVGAVTSGTVSPGSKVERGGILGESVGDEVYLEVRLEIGPGGFPVDPEPLLEWAR